MAKFELTANSQMYLGNGACIPKGQQMTINIPMMGINPNNLFGNSRCKEMLLQQFAVNGISLPSNSPFLNKGHWDVKMFPFQLSNETTKFIAISALLIFP